MWLYRLQGEGKSAVTALIRNWQGPAAAIVCEVMGQCAKAALISCRVQSVRGAGGSTGPHPLGIQDSREQHC